MDLTVDEMIASLDDIAGSLADREMYNALELLQQLRDELLHFVDEDDDE